MQTNNGLIYQAKTIEPNAVEHLQKSNLLLGDLAKSTYNYFWRTLRSSGLVALLSLIFWFLGL